MTYFYYKTNTWSNDSNQLPEQTKKLWERYSEKKNWRITELPNGYYQTEWQDQNENWKSVTRRETIDGAEKAIDSSVEHYTKKLKLTEGPVVVKTFE
jgi:hypothetical protein